MAYKDYTRVFVVVRAAQLSDWLGMISAKYGAAVCRFCHWRSCLQQLRDAACDVLIVDSDVTGSKTCHFIAQARRTRPWLSCIVLVGKGAVGRAVAVMKAGATDCLEKPGDPEPLLAAVEQGLRRAAAGTSLTAAQLSVLYLIVAGRTNRDIAKQLGRSVRTVETHRRSIFRKLGFRTSLEVMKWAMSAGFYGSPGLASDEVSIIPGD